MKNRKSVIALLLVAIIGIVGLTIAYFSSEATIENEFQSSDYGTTVEEVFTSPDNWTPGTTTPKTLTVTNTGNVDEAVRISYTETWTSANSNTEGDLDLTQNGNSAAIINWANTSDWTTVTENETTYKYYNYKLAPHETTSELLSSVTFNSAITNDENCVTSHNGQTIECTSTGNGYDGATYKLTFHIETVQYNKYEEAWGTEVEIATMKPMNARELALKSNPVSITNYTDGNVHEMYTFNHEATEQTPALTDYRYIGNDPYNYVYFNCDSLDNQNEETCEIWRIIGVFDVERPDPNDNTQTITERRMKLVRGSAFAETMTWDPNGVNEWSNSSLKVFLNENYYDELSEKSKLMIDNSIFYLGGALKAFETTTDDYYISERGNIIFNPLLNENYCNFTISENGICMTRALFWNGKISLIYVSDEFMVYGKGVNSTCYEEPGYCAGTKAKTGWIYNSNKLDGQNQLASATWSLVNVNASPNGVFYFISDPSPQGLGNRNSNSIYAVRPTLYLSSSVNIIDGDGSINNPYKLSV